MVRTMAVILMISTVYITEQGFLFGEISFFWATESL
jgi:hypothetical protein